MVVLMTLTPEAVANAFSGHRFAEAYPALHEDLRWTLVGSSVIVGREAAIEACEGTLAGLADTATRFLRFDTVVGEDVVVVDVEAEYESAEGSVTVASCDLYHFRDGHVVAIRSYTVEVGDS
jgi:ketosteroid isomerase-like protein